jgi:dephospho-CoA kinase
MGAGKTAAAHLLSSTNGALGRALGRDLGDTVVIDADLEAKTLMTTDRAVMEQLEQAFGGSIIRKNSISFTELGRIAFGSREKLIRLNAIVHPPLVRRLCALLDARSEKRTILDAAVLPLWKIEPWFDACLWIHAPFEMRLERLKQARSDLDEPALRQRMRLQEECLPAPRNPPWRKILNDGSEKDLAEALRM